MTVNFTRDCNVICGAYVEASTDAIITIDNSEQTHSCIMLGPSGNIQGSINFFDLKTGRVVVQRTVKQIPWTDRLLKMANQWEKKVKAAILWGRINFLNRSGEKFDWGNDYLVEIEVVAKDPIFIQPDFIAEIPGIDMDSDYEKIIGPKPDEEQDANPWVSKREAAARRNAGLETNVDVHVTTRGVDDDIEETPVDEVNDESDDKSDGGVYPLVAEEDHSSGYDPEEEGNYQPEPEVPIGRIHRIRRPQKKIIPTMKGKHHSSGVYGRTSLHQVEKLNESESDRIENRFVGSGYSTKIGVLNL